MRPRSGTTSRPRPRPRPRARPPAFGPITPVFAPQQKAAKQKTKRARTKVAPAPRPAIPQIRNPTPAQQRTAARLRARSDARARRLRRQATRRSEARAIQRIAKQARQQERYYGSYGARARKYAGPPTPLPSTRKKQLMLRAGHDAAFSQLMQRTGTLTLAERQQARKEYLDTKRKPKIDVTALAGDVIRRVYGSPVKKGKGGKIGTSVLQTGTLSVPALAQVSPAKRAERIAPALPYLEQIQRPVHASAGIADEIVTSIKSGEVPTALDLAGAGWKGLSLKEKKLYTDVLTSAGMKDGTIKTILGFGLDVFADPTTYVTGGTASIGVKAGVHAAERAAVAGAKAKALELAPKVAAGKISKSAARAEARKAGKRAGDAAFKQAKRKAEAKGQSKGITIKVTGGKTARRVGRAARRKVLPKSAEKKLAKTIRRVGPVSPVTRTTAGINRAGRAVTGLTGKGGVRLGRAGREVAAGAHAGVRPGSMKPAEFAAVKTATRESRAEAEKLIRRSTARSNALLVKLAPDERRLVLDAIEAKDLKSLRGQAATRRIHGRKQTDPDRLYDVAKRVDDELRYRERVETRAGSLYSEIGERGVGRGEVEHMAQAGRTAPKVEPKRVARDEAEGQFAAARANLRNASTPEERFVARQELEVAGQRLTNARSRLKGAEAEREAAAAGRKGFREEQAKRLEGEARAYFPHMSEQEVQTTIGRILDAGVSKRALNLRRPDTTKAREYRESLAMMREGTPEQQARAAKMSENVPRVMAQSGAGSARKAQVALASRKIADLAGEPVTKTLGKTKQAVLASMRDLEEEGRSVYRLSGGHLERLGTDEAGEVLRAAQGGAGNAARYVILSDSVKDAATAARGIPGSDLTPVLAYDAMQRGWKTFTLLTLSYYVRNAVGDLWNAFGQENIFRLARNLPRGQRILRELGKMEKAERKFNGQLDPSLRQIKLTPEQAHELAGPSADRIFQVVRKGNPQLSKQEVRQLVEDNLNKGKVPAFVLAQMAERSGVIRQGRFLELMTEARPVTKAGRRANALTDAAKRAEDSVRIATWLGGLQRGMSAREAAEFSLRAHFDYGDLTQFEKGFSRRVMPFYTFTSRNIPQQARIMATKPGKYAALAKGIEEGRRATGLPEDYEQNLDEFERRQLGIPMRIGDQLMTVSAGAPFVDANDVVGVTQNIAAGDPFAAGKVLVQKAAELGTPFIKLPLELTSNYSAFYRDEIQPSSDPETRAPDWAIFISKMPGGDKFAKATGLVDDWLDPVTREAAPGWSKRADYFFRNILTGPAKALIEATGTGAETQSARRMTPGQRIGALGGLRARTYDPQQGELMRLYDESERVQGRMDQLNGRAHPTIKVAGKPVPINAEYPTPEYERLSEARKALMKRIDEIQRQTRGVVKGRPNVPGTAPEKRRLPTGGPTVSTGTKRLPTEADLKLGSTSKRLPTG